MEKQKSQTQIENYLISAVFSGDAEFDIFEQCVEAGVTPQSFCSTHNFDVWTAFVAINARGELLEQANVVVELSKDPLCEVSFDDIEKYREFKSSPSQWAGFAAALVKNRTLRAMSRDLQVGLEAIEDGAEPHEIISDLQKSFNNIESVGNEDLNMEDIAQLVYDNLLDDNRPDKEYIPTGLTQYDSTLKGGGFGDGQLVVWAARPALGKTTVALNAAFHNAKANVPIGVISLEMVEYELGEKLAAMDCGIPVAMFEEKLANAEQKKRLHEALKKWKKLPLEIDCRSRTLAQICLKCKQWVKKKGVKMVVIDYCQLIKGDRNLPREQQIAEISRELKMLASELSIPIILVCQLNRDSEKNDRRPLMSDLRESGALEQDANSITFLYLLEEDRATGAPEYVRWYRAKQRAGQTADGKFGFRRDLGIFSTYIENNGY